MNMKKYVDGGEVRCVQAAFRMIIDAFLDIDPGMKAAEELTGYVEGRGTWQFKMLLAFANYGLNVKDHENLDVENFLTDPKSAIRRQVGDEDVALSIFAETDFDYEVSVLRECLSSERIQFIQKVPSIKDIEREIENGCLVMISVNRAIIRNKDGRDGHILIVESINDKEFVVHDPGTGGGLSKSIDRDLLERAWESPSRNMCNYISVCNSRR